MLGPIISIKEFIYLLIHRDYSIWDHKFWRQLYIY